MLLPNIFISKSSIVFTPMNLYVYHIRECDPKKCTGLKLKRLNLAKLVYNIKQIPREVIILYPFCEEFISKRDRGIVESFGLGVVDCSWNKISPRRIRSPIRRLPFLLAANPINYSIPYKLSSLEAFTAALYITGFYEKALLLISKVKWGRTFISLNEEALLRYASAETHEEIAKI
ncbi:MAG: DUF367 family protein, partial [Candidatus Methanomethyliaceae archaeon]|nr:DUF367 family protein [Candidatus Methanomethyliaceae archaeon]